MNPTPLPDRPDIYLTVAALLLTIGIYGLLRVIVPPRDKVETGEEIRIDIKSGDSGQGPA